jgi:hypothetical protein
VDGGIGKMKNSETLDRLSLVLMGLAIGFFLGGLVQVLDLPSWVQVFGAIFFLIISLIANMRAMWIKEGE